MGALRGSERKGSFLMKQTQVAKELVKGDPLTLGNFDQCWGALVRTLNRSSLKD